MSSNLQRRGLSTSSPLLAHDRGAFSPNPASSSSAAVVGSTTARDARGGDVLAPYPEPSYSQGVGDTVRSKMRVSKLARPIVLLPMATLLVLLVVLNRQPDGHWTRQYEGLKDRFDSYRQTASSTRSRTSSKELGEFDCNPFQEIGKLILDDQHPRRTAWIPYDPRCKVSSYMRHLYRLDEPQGVPMIPSHAEDDPEVEGSDLTGPRRYLPWLQNRTIVFVGDSIDRFVLKDICSFAKGNLFNVGLNHPAVPPAYQQTIIPELGANGQELPDSVKRRKERKTLEDQWAHRGPGAQEQTNPWVCDISEYGATLVNVFTFGLEGGEKWFKNEPWYHGPESYIDRLHYIAKPLLRNLARHMQRPQIEHPDLITSHANYWNLRRYAEEDFTSAGKQRPYPEDDPLVFTNLSPLRESQIENELRRSLRAIARAFRGPDARIRNGPVILWRSMHQTPRHNYAPWSRTFQADSLSRHTIRSMRNESTRRKASQEDYGFDERLRIDEFGPLLRGTQHLFRDLGHPNAVPGSWLRGDILLYELKRAVMGIDRSNSKASGKKH